ncbi:MAG TPA: hypothetical protein VF591_13420 [Pyrinomonadaceae bacterium]|jgi:hypothetical protein
MSSNRKCLKKGCKYFALPREPYCEFHRPAPDPGMGATGGGGHGPLDAPIIISGGSVVIEFDDDVFPPAGRGKHANPNKKIRSVEIDVDGSAPQIIDVPNGKVVVRIYYDNP